MIIKLFKGWKKGFESFCCEINWKSESIKLFNTHQKNGDKKKKMYQLKNYFAQSSVTTWDTFFLDTTARTRPSMSHIWLVAGGTRSSPVNDRTNRNSISRDRTKISHLVSFVFWSWLPSTAFFGSIYFLFGCAVKCFLLFMFLHHLFFSPHFIEESCHVLILQFFFPPKVR